MFDPHRIGPRYTSQYQRDYGRVIRRRATESDDSGKVTIERLRSYIPLMRTNGLLNDIGGKMTIDVTKSYIGVDPDHLVSFKNLYDVGWRGVSSVTVTNNTMSGTCSFNWTNGSVDIGYVLGYVMFMIGGYRILVDVAFNMARQLTGTLTINVAIGDIPLNYFNIQALDGVYESRIMLAPIDVGIDRVIMTIVDKDGQVVYVNGESSSTYVDTATWNITIGTYQPDNRQFLVISEKNFVLPSIWK